MTIHSEHPFADAQRDPVRQLRGRVGGTVTLWTAGRGGERAGLTVTSYVVAPGDPAHLLGLVDPDADLTEQATTSGTVVVQLLEWRHRELAEVFAGLFPSPGGPFQMGEWEDTDWGPVLLGASAWVGLRIESDPRHVGWSVVLDGVVERVELGRSEQPLLHRRGRYLTLT